MNLLIKVLIILVLSMLGSTSSYKVPNVDLEIIDNKFIVSIPDDSGTDEVQIFVTRYDKFQSVTQSNYTAQIVRRRGIRWAAEIMQLNPMDTIFVTISVMHNEHEYHGVSICAWETMRCQLQEVDNSNVPSTNDSTTAWQTETLSIYCDPTVTEVTNHFHRVCKGDLIFEDNFNTFNASKWMHEVRAPLDSGDVEFVLYDGEVQIKDGQLEIKPILWSSYEPDIDVLHGKWEPGTRCTGTHDLNKECQIETGGPRILPPVVAPRITTRDSFSFKYGRVEIRAKLPKGDWLNPLLLLEPELYSRTGYESVQLRVAFAHGNERLDNSNGKSIDGRILYGGPIIFREADRRDVFMVSTRRNMHFGNDFHNYSLTWTPEELVLAVDNQIYGEISGPFSGVSPKDVLMMKSWKRGSVMAPFDQPFHLTFGLSVGGFGDYPDNLRSGNHTKPWTNYEPKAKLKFFEHQQDWFATWHNPNLLVDYVRVYAL